MGCGSSSLVTTLHQPTYSTDVPKEPVTTENMEEAVVAATPMAPSQAVTDTSLLVDPNSQLAPKTKGLKNFGTAKMELDELYVQLDRRCSELLATEDYSTVECQENLHFIREVSIYGRSSPEKKLAVATYLHDKGLAEIFRRVWEFDFPLDFLNPKNKVILTNMKFVMVAMWNSTDRSVALCDQVIHMNLHKDILRYLGDEKMNPEQLGDTRKIYIVKGLLGILHNTVQSCIAAREAYRECSAVALFRNFRAASNEMVQLKANILLAYIITEDENEVINADSKIFTFLVSILESAFTSPDHHSKKYGFKAVELITALNKLAANDANKERIVESGALPFFVQLLQPECSAQEHKMAAQGLWILSFKCSKAIKNEPGCLEALKRLSESSNTTEDVRKMAEGAVWVMDGQNLTEAQRRKNKKLQGHDNEERSLTPVSEDVHHVMLSYQWQSQPIMLQVKERLAQAGYLVWMDVDHMSGSILEAMALAVENAAVILTAVSHKYKESPNCRTEAEYAFRLHKPIVPLMVEQKYKPDGWLGAFVGNKLYFAFSDQSRFEASMLQLVKELGDRGKRRVNGAVTATKVPALVSAKNNPPGESDVIDRPHRGPLYAPSTSSTGTAGWTSMDVGRWLDKNGLGAHKKALVDIDGGLLLEMRALLLVAPEFFCSTLKNDLHFSFVDVVKFSKTVKQLL